MALKTFSTAVAVFAVSVASQTFTDCNPLETTCPPEPALGKAEIDCDFTQGECDAFSTLPGTSISYDDDGALFSIETDKQAPTIAASKFIFFGRLEVELKAALGQGVVTSVVLQSADLDEIDWEWVGGSNDEVQTNYFGKGDTTTYDRGAYHSVSEPLSTFHTYTIEWTSQKIDWIIDGEVVRTLEYEDAQGGERFPQTPMEIKLGTWVAGLPDAPEGTVDWAGGYTDFSQAPFNAWYKSVSVVDYAGGDGPTEDSVREYVYGDNSGSWESIEVVLGEGSDDSEDGDSTSATTGASSATQSVPSASASAASTLSSAPSTPTSGGHGNGTSSSVPDPTNVPASAGHSKPISLVVGAVAGAAMLVAQAL